MKLTYLANAVIPSRSANSINVMKSCYTFAQNGHEVTLIIPKCRNTESKIRNIYQFYGVAQNFSVMRVLPLGGLRKAYGFTAAGWAKFSKPSIVYGRDLSGCCIAVLLGLPTVVEVHKAPRLYHPIAQWLFSQIVGREQFRRLVVISDALRKIFEESYPQLSHRICVAPNGADPIPDDVKPVKLVNAGTRLQVGYIGHLYKVKGMDLINKIVKGCTWADFHIIGGTERDLKNLREELEACNNISFHGFIPPGQLDAFRKAFDVVLLPYQRPEGAHGSGETGGTMSPLKMFEYMASGTAILCSDLPVFREVLNHEETALLCDPGSPREWIDALGLLRKNIVLRHRLGNSAKQAFLTSYTRSMRAVKVLSGLP
jgi:glycosyltransferase involved in cell wall biosynthesis